MNKATSGIREPLAYLNGADDAIDFWKTSDHLSGAEKAIVIAVLSNAGLKNRQIRDELTIEEAYEISQLKRIGTTLTREQLELWHENEHRISLGHVRALAMIDDPRREYLMRNILIKKVSVSELFRLAKGEEGEELDADVERFRRLMSEVIGRDVRLSYNSGKQSGKITLPYYGVDDLGRICKQLGFDSEKHL